MSGLNFAGEFDLQEARIFSVNDISLNLLSPLSNISSSLCLAASPAFFSTRSLVLDSGVFIPCSLILFLTQTEKPMSI